MVFFCITSFFSFGKILSLDDVFWFVSLFSSLTFSDEIRRSVFSLGYSGVFVASSVASTEDRFSESPEASSP